MRLSLFVVVLNSWMWIKNTWIWVSDWFSSVVYTHQVPDLNLKSEKIAMICKVYSAVLAKTVLAVGGMLCLVMIGCNGDTNPSVQHTQPATTQATDTNTMTPTHDNTPRPEHSELATFAGGCFWCIQPPYDDLSGVISTTVGYIGGQVPNPTYEQVCTATTGHAEAVQIVFDPAQITYEQLLDVFWRNIDPTTVDQQFADFGSQYRTEIFVHNDEQQRIAEASKKKLDESGKFDRPIVTQISAASTFYPAEDYHQKYYVKCPLRYQGYKKGSGREAFIKETWGPQKNP